MCFLLAFPLLFSSLFFLLLACFFVAFRAFLLLSVPFSLHPFSFFPSSQVSWAALAPWLLGSLLCSLARLALPCVHPTLLATLYTDTQAAHAPLSHFPFDSFSFVTVDNGFPPEEVPQAACELLLLRCLCFAPFRCSLVFHLPLPLPPHAPFVGSLCCLHCWPLPCPCSCL